MGYAPSPAPAVDEWPFDLYVDLLATGPIAVALTVLLAVGFIAEIIHSHYGRRSSFLKLLVNIAKSPLVHWIGQFQAFVINAPYWNELYIVWGVLLFTGFSSFYSIIDYSIHTSNKKKLMLSKEKIQLVNTLGALTLVWHYTLWYTKLGVHAEHRIYGDHAPAPSDDDPPAGKGHFVVTLWVIWGFSLIKILYQIKSYCYYDYISARNTKWVAFYMKSQQNVQNFDPKTMTGYRYLLEEIPPKADCNPPNYEIVINDEDMKHLVTIEDVWMSKGRLLAYNVGNKLKQTCLSFALFKMLKRRFEEECETAAEADRPETRDFIRWGILEFSSEEVFKIIDTELRFLRDFFYTKYPTVLSFFGFPLYTLLFGIMFTSFFGIFFKLHHYISPKHDINKKKLGLSHQNRDVEVTRVILFTVMIIVLWEIISYLFSNWSKVLLVCKYVKHQKNHYHLLINTVLLWVVRSIYIPGQSTYEIGQYSLLHCCKIFHYNCCCWSKYIYFPYMDRFMNVNYVSLKKVNIMEAILPSMKQFLNPELNHTTKITALSRHRVEGELPSWVCELQNPIQTVMIWHVATNFCWMIKKTEMKKKGAEPVAVNISNYCAYLVVCAPELLPINTYVCNVIAEQIVQERCHFFQGTSEKGLIQKMEKVEENEEKVICRGALLGKMLRNVIKVDEDLWEFLKEVWAELILRLAPSETNVAHAMKLADGGEFMTYLWVLLYHAGLINQASLKDGTTSMA